MNLEVRRISKDEGKVAVKRIKSGKVDGRLNCGDMNFRGETVEYNFVMWLCCGCVVLFVMLLFVLWLRCDVCDAVVCVVVAWLCSGFYVRVADVFRISCGSVVVVLCCERCSCIVFPVGREGMLGEWRGSTCNGSDFQA